MLEAEHDHIARAKQGDREAFGGLYDHYASPIYRFVAMKVTVREEAEDILHEVFLSAWQNMPSYESRGLPFSSWLYRIARNRVIDHYRTKKTLLSLDNEETGLSETLIAGTISSGELIDIKFNLERVRQALRKLSPDQQDVLILRFIEELTPAEIAKVLGKREGAIRIIQHRAVQNLKKILAESPRYESR